MASKPRTLYEKIWDAHVVEQRNDGTSLIFIDRHLVHEVTSPQAFEALRMNGRKVRRPELTLAVPDHNLPTTARLDESGNPVPIADQQSRRGAHSPDRCVSFVCARRCPARASEPVVLLALRLPSAPEL